jgi:glycosyltransferase involved in cell wall biosynthesis
MSASTKYVVAFRGRRDSYQVPLALDEADMLDEFITDAYFGSALSTIARVLPKGLQERMRSHYEPALTMRRVKCLWGITAIEHLRHRLGYIPSVTFAKLDCRFSLAAATRARATRSHLFLYSPYAWEAFTARYHHTPRKILFQFHPHPDLERRILLEDSRKYPFVRHSFEEEVGEQIDEGLKRRNRDCWRHADVILCASSFSRRSVVEAGAEASVCKIVPYGIDVPDEEADSTILDRFNALFVGAGTQRKGLHHLLLAWQKSTLPACSLLTLVCRVIDPAIAALARQTPNVRLIRGVRRDQLTDLFKNSSILVMPSLVEGFGQVYLEALALGCPVLGTTNTCLPDLRGDERAIWQVEPGQIDQLVSLLETVSQTLPGNHKVRSYARACAAPWSWAHFRDGIRSALEIDKSNEH